MKKISLHVLSMLFTILILSVSAVNVFAVDDDIVIASLKGPTTMGMVKLLSDAENGEYSDNYRSEIYGTADEIVTGLVNGEIDIAAIPCNLASVLYNKTKGGIRIAAVNTLGVLYIVENGKAISTIDDLRGKTIYSTGKGTTPEFVLNYVLSQNGIDPKKDVTIEFKSESTEVAAILGEKTDVVAMLPQPYVAAVMMQNDSVRIALDMTAEWDKVSLDSGTVTGVLVARSSFIDENKEAFDNFLVRYQESTAFVNANMDEAAEMIANYGIVAKAPIAKAALPYCNITYVAGEEMQTMVGGYLQVLADANPQSIGGKLPEKDFYYLN